MNWIWKTVIFVVIIALLGVGIYKLWIQNRKLEAEANKLDATLTEIEDENRELRDRVEYFENPENLVKELKSQFNYKEQGEEMIIVVPKTNGEE